MMVMRQEQRGVTIRLGHHLLDEMVNDREIGVLAQLKEQYILFVKKPKKLLEIAWLIRQCLLKEFAEEPPPRETD